VHASSRLQRAAANAQRNNGESRGERSVVQECRQALRQEREKGGHVAHQQAHRPYAHMKPPPVTDHAIPHQTQALYKPQGVYSVYSAAVVQQKALPAMLWKGIRTRMLIRTYLCQQR